MRERTGTGCRPAEHPSSSLRHAALLYADQTEYMNAVSAFVNEGLDAGEPVLIAVSDPALDLISPLIDVHDDNVHLAEMDDLGRNPRRIIPAVLEFLREHTTGPARFIGNASWAGRPLHEAAESVRQDSLLNRALADYDLRVLCPYDVTNLSSPETHNAWRSHPVVISAGAPGASGSYADPAEMCADEQWPLDPPPARGFLTAAPVDELSTLRSLVYRRAMSTGASIERIDDLVMAVNEVATNSILYAPGTGFLTMWLDTDRRIVCEISDGGHITDPLAGCYPPGPDFEARGLWLVNQLCDLVEIRSGPDGTCVRVRVTALP